MQKHIFECKLNIAGVKNLRSHQFIGKFDTFSVRCTNICFNLPRKWFA